MTQTIILSLLISMSFISCSQSSKTVSNHNKSSEKCAELFSKKISNDSGTLALDLIRLTECTADIDTFDVTYGGPYIIQLATKNREAGLTYSEFMDDFQKFKKDKMYSDFKRSTYNDYILKRRVADYKNWSNDSLLLEKMGVPSDFIRNYGEYVQTHADGVKTHAVLSEEYRESLKMD
ncbi:hypothetical protein [Lishizhenia tianjinensis]|nr:hypothetical protein [Lishizhenia tianjinensis]